MQLHDDDNVCAHSCSTKRRECSILPDTTSRLRSCACSHMSVKVRPRENFMLSQIEKVFFSKCHPKVSTNNRQISCGFISYRLSSIVPIIGYGMTSRSASFLEMFVWCISPQIGRRGPYICGRIYRGRHRYNRDGHFQKQNGLYNFSYTNNSISLKPETFK